MENVRRNEEKTDEIVSSHEVCHVKGVGHDEVR